jgi:hypothetical protein
MDVICEALVSRVVRKAAPVASRSLEYDAPVNARKLPFGNLCKSRLKLPRTNQPHREQTLHVRIHPHNAKIVPPMLASRLIVVVAKSRYHSMTNGQNV